MLGEHSKAMDPEVCRFSMRGLDCVTFYENVLCIARILKKGQTSLEDFIRELTFVRYRDGKLEDYTSRLHYSSDWFDNNVAKGVVKDITAEIGGKPLDVQVSFMSQHPKYYPALKSNPAMVSTIATIEKQINQRPHWYVPQDEIKAVQPKLQNGDILGFVTSKKGLDYAHTGMVYRDKEGVTRALHASLSHKKVVVDDELYRYVKGVKSHIGISVYRPLKYNHKLRVRIWPRH